jgi:type I restriction enzyme, R subunit
VAPDQIRTVVRCFHDSLPEIFPGRTDVPKTLVFAKDDSHAEEIVKMIRREFGKGNDFCKKITYRVTGTDPETLIKDFRQAYNPRIAVSVDMMATGTDIRPLECLLFMRDVKSQIYFDQMKGRGTRVVDDAELQLVTPDAATKTHFVIVDAVGVCETDKTDTRPLDRDPSVRWTRSSRTWPWGSETTTRSRRWPHASTGCDGRLPSARSRSWRRRRDDP